MLRRKIQYFVFLKCVDRNKIILHFYNRIVVEGIQWAETLKENKLFSVFPRDSFKF